MQLNLHFLLLLSATVMIKSGTTAFVTKTNHVSAFTSVTEGRNEILQLVALSKHQMMMSKKKDETKSSATDIGTLLSPLNPYMWFIYFFLFIFAADAFHLGPGSS